MPPPRRHPRPRRAGSRAPASRARAAASTSPPCRSTGARSPPTTTSTGTGNASRAAASGGRSYDDCGSTTSTPSRSTSALHGSDEAGIVAGRDELERVAEVASDRALAHVGADDAYVALAVLAQRPHERRRARRARGSEQNRDRLHERSIRSSASWRRRASRSASSIDSIVSRIRAPSNAQISGWIRSCSQSSSPRASASVGSPLRKC